ncbi:MAG: pitrilysin family protein [Acidobacteriota bacterium]
MRASILIFPLLLLGCAAAHAGLFPYKTHEEVLPNGLKCIVVPLDNPGLVAYLTIVRTGSRDEVEPGHTGFAHFFEHMMFRGTEKYPADLYGKIHVEMGADENAFTSDDLTCYHLTFSKQYLEKVMDTESDRFMNLKYSKPDFQKEAKAILGEYNKSYMNPFFQFEEKVLDTAYEKHTYKHTTMGFLKDIEDMPNQYEYSLQFFDRFYRPNNCVLVIVGDVEPAATMALVRKYYSDWKPGTYKPTIAQEPEQQAEKACHVDYKGQTLPLLGVAYKAPAFDPADKEFASLFLLARLSFGETSAVFNELVLKDQKVDFIQGFLDPHRDPYLFMVMARLKNVADMQAVQDRVDAAVEQARAQPPDPAMLADLKSNLKYGFLMDLDSTKRTAMSLIQVVQLTGGLAALDTFWSTVDAITPADVQKAAQKFLEKSRRTRCTLYAGAK